MLLDIHEFLNRELLNNSFRQYAWMLGAVLFVVIFKRYISKMISKFISWLLRKTSAGKLTEQFFSLLLAPLESFIILNTIYFGLRSLVLPDGWGDDMIEGHGATAKELLGFSIQSFLFGVYHFLLILNIAWLVSRIGDFLIKVMRFKADQTEDPYDDQIIGFFKDIIKLFVWLIAALALLGIVFHVNITSLIAGAGIAGIAIAFAAQETLQNMFGSIVIFTEKPFVVGDLVEVDGITGTIERVGFRSTRVRTQDTSYTTIPNKNIVNNRISNLRLRKSRRIQFILALNYDTPPEVLNKIIIDIKTYGQNHPESNNEPIVTFYNFGTYALEIWVEVFLVYKSWEPYMFDRNNVLFEIMRIVKENGGHFAYPTQTLKVEELKRED